LADQLQQKLAKNKGEKVALEMGFTALPIDPKLIAAKLDILCEPKQLDGFSGCLLRMGENFGILFSSDFNTEGVINFTIGHELGHFFLEGHPQKLFPNGDGMHRSGLEFSSIDSLEIQADHFAAGLLMPEKLFRAEMEKANDGGFDAIQRLSSACKTSLTATAIRYSELVDYPLAVIVNTGKRIDYCFMSDALREGSSLSWIRKGDLIPKDSGTFTFNKDLNNIRSGKSIESNSYLDQWFRGAPSMEFNEDVIGLGEYGKTLTVLFSYEPMPVTASDAVES
jgi:IrrE N-terminal-like domain